MVDVGDESTAINWASHILQAGFFVSTVFFPIVRRGHSQLRICISATHTEEQIHRLVAEIKKLTGQNVNTLKSVVNKETIIENPIKSLAA